MLQDVVRALRTGRVNRYGPIERHSRGLKPALLWAYGGAAEAMPCRKPWIGLVLTIVVIILVIGSVPARAQNGRISGVVTDPQGANVADATVQALNLDTAVKITTKTDDSGAFRVPYLLAGRYQILVQAPGFDDGTSEVLELRAGQEFVFNVQLAVASTRSTVNVNAEAVTQVNTETAEVSGTITAKEVTELQLNGRNFSQLIALAPGVSNQTSQDEARVGPAGSVSYSVNGGRVEYNSFQVDGSETLNVGINKDHTSLIVTPSIDAIQEIKVLTSNYGAQYPSTGNGTTIITTKSGTDQYHGSLYEFFRNEALNAKGYFDVGNRAPLYRRNDFGGTIGGPLSIPHLYDGKSKTHFFFSEEARLESDPYAYRRAVPSLAELNGDFSDVCPYALPGQYAVFTPNQYPDCPAFRINNNGIPPALTFPGNRLPAVSQTATALINTGLIPVPNTTIGCNSTIGSCYVTDVSLPTYYREELVRLDHAVTQKSYLSLRYIHDEWDATTPVPQYATVQNSFPTIRNRFYGPGTSVVARLVSQVSPQFSNELAFSFTYSKITLNDLAAPYLSFSRPPAIDAPPCASDGVFSTPPVASDCGLGWIFNNAKFGKVPGISIAGSNAAYGGNGFSVDPGYMPWEHTNPTYGILDNAEKLMGRHALKFGVNVILFRRNQTNGPIGAASGDVQGLLTFNGGATENSFADFLLMGQVALNGGSISSFQQDSAQARYHQSYRVIEPYFQDDWKVTPRFTLNAGLRLSLFGLFKERNHNAYNWTAKAFSRALSESTFVAAGSGQLYDATTKAAVPIYLPNGQVNPQVINGIVRCGVNGVPDGCMTGHLVNPAPRIGFAWDVFGNAKLAIRGGYGIFFEHGTADEANAGSLEASAPQVLSMAQFNPPSAGCIGYAAPDCQIYKLGTPGAFPINVTAIPTKAVWPYVQQWSFGVERALPGNTLVNLGYVGSKGTHLTLQREANQLIPLPAASNPFDLHEPLLRSDCLGSPNPDLVGSFQLANGALIWPSNPAYTSLETACFGLGFGATNGTNPNAFRTFAPGLGNIYSLENTANSGYNAFQATLRRVAGPLTFGLSYTYSHSLDDSSDRSDANFVNSFDVRSNRASSSFDQRHLLHVSYIYNLPIRPVLQGLLSYLNSDPDWDNQTPVPPRSSFITSPVEKLLFDNWQLSGITLFETGTPFSVINGGSPNGVSVLDNAGVFNGVGAGSYPDICGDPYGHIPAGGNNSQSFGPLLRNPGAFCAPRGLTFGTAGRNALRNPSRLNFDMALAKQFTLLEGTHLEFRAEAFNIFNHTQFRLYNPTLGNQPNNTISCYGPGSANYSAGFGGDANNNGCLTGNSFLHPVDAHRPRTIQFGLKLAF